jgi:hypothetical protein
MKLKQKLLNHYSGKTSQQVNDEIPIGILKINKHIFNTNLCYLN